MDDVMGSVIPEEDDQPVMSWEHTDDEPDADVDGDAGVDDEEDEAEG